MRKALLILFVIVAVVAGFWMKKGRVSLANLKQEMGKKAIFAHNKDANIAKNTDTLLAESCPDILGTDTDSTFIAQLIKIDNQGLSEEDKLRFKTLAPLFEKTMPNSQFFVAQANKVIILKGKNGTKLTIPKQTFVTADNQMPTCEIQIELKELYNVSGLLLASLPTLSDYGILAAEGTFYLNATANGKALKINKGITVEIPTTRKETNRGLFYGNQTTNGAWRWIASLDNYNKDYNSIEQPNTDTENTDETFEQGNIMLGGASANTLWAGVEYCLDSAEKMGINTQSISQYINLFQQSSYNWWGIDNTATETELPDDTANSSDSYPNEPTTTRKYKSKLPRMGNTFTATQMGWISVNRNQPFYTPKKHLTARINAPQNTSVSAFLVLKNMSVVISAIRDAEGNYIFDKVPRGMKGYLVAMTYKQDQPYIDILTINTGENPVETLTLRPTTVDQLKYQVMQLK
jgi:hypothetical protein